MFGISEIVAHSEIDKLQATNQYNAFVKICPDLRKIDIDEFVSLQKSDRDLIISKVEAVQEQRVV